MNKWTIIYDDGFIKQISQLDIKIQTNIQREISKIALLDDPLRAGLYSDCGGNSDYPYIAQVYPGLLFEFIYEMDAHNKVLRYLGYLELDILNHSQEPTI